MSFRLETELGLDASLTPACNAMHARMGKSIYATKVCASFSKQAKEITFFEGMTGTYNGDIKHGHIATDSGWTYGGYSASQTVHQKYSVNELIMFIP